MTDSFDLAGGNGGISFSFGPQGSQPGASVTGTILDMKEVHRTNFDSKKLEFWDNGDPKMQTRISLQTQLRDPALPNDDGKRDVFLDGRKKPNDNGTKSRICAVLDAVRASTGGTSIQRGGLLTVTWVSGMGFSGDPRNYEAAYQPPALDLGGGGQVTQAAPVQQYQQPPVTAQQFIPPQQPVAAAPVQQAPQPVAQAPTPAAAPAQPTGPTPEAIAALTAAGVDPATVYGAAYQPA